jgi:hypothetical protein
MEPYREKVADTIWVLAKLLKSKPPRPGSVRMSIVGDNKQAVYPLHASTKQAQNIVRKFRFFDSRGWLLGHRYVYHINLYRRKRAVNGRCCRSQYGILIHIAASSGSHRKLWMD